MDSKDVRRVEVFGLLQMAAEALVVGEASAANGQFTIGSVPESSLIDAIKFGNGHASKFTEESAKKFAKEWTVVKQQASTSTGFSATLFQYKGKDDPDRGLVTGQFVLSFRSTEFIDDAVRDNLETDLLGLIETVIPRRRRVAGLGGDAV